MKGRHMGTCSGCGEKKGDRDSNAGWYELSPRGAWSERKMLFCPTCAGVLLVGLDEKMSADKKPQNLIAVHKWDLLRILRVLQEATLDGLVGGNLRGERDIYVDVLARLLKRVPWASFDGGLR